MKSRDTINVFWTFFEKGAYHVLGLVQSVILARFLSPEDFGAVAMLWIFVAIGMAISEGGMGSSLVVYGYGERQAARYNIGVSVGLSALICLLAPAITSYYGNDRLLPLLRTMSLSIIVPSLSCVYRARLSKSRRFRDLSLGNMCGVMASVLISTTLAMLGAGAWSIVAIGIVQPGVAGLYIYTKARNLDVFERECTSAVFRQILKYGLKLMMSQVLNSIYKNVSSLLIGKRWDVASVGLYSRGQRWAALPVDVANEAVGRVAFVSMSGQRTMLWRFCVFECALLWPALVVIFVLAEPIVVICFGEQWIESVKYLRVLMLGGFVAPVTNLCIVSLNASGRSDVTLAVDFIRYPIAIGAIVMSACFGMLGLCWAFVLCNVFEMVISLVAYRRYLGRGQS